MRRFLNTFGEFNLLKNCDSLKTRRNKNQVLRELESQVHTDRLVIRQSCVFISITFEPKPKILDNEREHLMFPKSRSVQCKFR